MSRRGAALTASEAASVTRVPLKQVHRIIDAGLLAGSVENREGTRVILGTGIVGLKLAHATAEILTLAARRRVVQAVLRRPKLRAVREQAVTIEVGPIASAVRAGLEALARARRLVSSDEAVLGGARCFKGTRICVHDIAEMVANGDSMADILKAYPQLGPEMVDAAVVYADAYPRRGRPPRRAVRHRSRPRRSVSVGDLPHVS